MGGKEIQDMLHTVDMATLENLIVALGGTRTLVVERALPESPPNSPGRLFMKTRVLVKKFANDQAFQVGDAYEVKVSEGNVAINNGIQLALDQMINVSSQPYWAGTSLCGVGNSSTTEAATDSGLIGASQAFIGMDATFPSRSSQTVSWQGSFGAAVANFAWGEFTMASTAEQGKFPQAPGDSCTICTEGSDE